MLSTDVETDAQVVRAGMDSLAWLLNNAHNHDLPSWDGLVKAAREDRSTALAALDRILAELQQVKDGLNLTANTLYDTLAENERYRDALERIADNNFWTTDESMVAICAIARAALDRGTA